MVSDEMKIHISGDGWVSVCLCVCERARETQSCLLLRHCECSFSLIGCCFKTDGMPEV